VSEDRTQKQSQTPRAFVSFIAVNKNHAMVTKVEENKINFLLDSGASDHMASSDLEKHMTDIKVLEKPIFLCTLQMVTT
jgi:hypothetical protein